MVASVAAVAARPPPRADVASRGAPPRGGVSLAARSNGSLASGSSSSSSPAHPRWILPSGAPDDAADRRARSARIEASASRPTLSSDAFRGAGFPSRARRAEHAARLVVPERTVRRAPVPSRRARPSRSLRFASLVVPRALPRGRNGFNDFMDDLSSKFPREMEETRLRVQADVRRSLKAAKRLVAAQACFVLAIVLVKRCLTGGDGASSPLTPSAFVAGRALVSLPFLYFLARSDPKSFAELRAEFSALLSSSSVLVLGALNCLGQLLLAHGLAWSSVGNAVVIGQLVAVYSCTIAVFQGVEKASAGKFLAIGAGVLGAAVMLDPANMWLTRGNLALLARAAVFAAYLALQAPVLRAYRPVTVACAAQLIGAVGAICVGLPFSAFGELDFDFSSSVSPGTGTPPPSWLGANASGFSGAHLARLVAVAALSSAAYALTAEAEKHVTPVVTACYNSLQPVMALIVACALGDVPGFRELTGSALIVFGGLFAVALSTNDRARWKQSYPVGDFGVDRDYPRTRTYRRAEDDASKTVSKTVRGGGRSDETRERLGAIAAPPSDEAAGRRPESSSRESPGAAETRTGTVRIARPAPTRRPEARAVAWTVAWALVMSLCALAGGGLLTWSLVYLYWKFVV